MDLSLSQPNKISSRGGEGDCPREDQIPLNPSIRDPTNNIESLIFKNKICIFENYENVL